MFWGMAGKSRKEMQPFFKKLCEQYECETISELSRKTGIELQVLRNYAYDLRYPSAWKTALQFADAAGVPVDSVMRELEIAQGE